MVNGKLLLKDIIDLCNLKLSLIRVKLRYYIVKPSLWNVNSKNTEGEGWISNELQPIPER